MGLRLRNNKRLPMIEVFKTNVLTKETAKMMLSLLSKTYPDLKINFDLSDCDKILRVQGNNISAEKIIELITANGYQCEVLV
jgi:tRNA G26 N,N-dimethylase Trm1